MVGSANKFSDVILVFDCFSSPKIKISHFFENWSEKKEKTKIYRMIDYSTIYEYYSNFVFAWWYASHMHERVRKIEKPRRNRWYNAIVWTTNDFCLRQIENTNNKFDFLVFCFTVAFDCVSFRSITILTEYLILIPWQCHTYHSSVDIITIILNRSLH